MLSVFLDRSPTLLFGTESLVELAPDTRPLSLWESVCLYPAPAPSLHWGFKCTLHAQILCGCWGPDGAQVLVLSWQPLPTEPPLQPPHYLHNRSKTKKHCRPSSTSKPLSQAAESYLYSFQTSHVLPGFCLTMCLASALESVSADIALPIGSSAPISKKMQHSTPPAVPHMAPLKCSQASCKVDS